jgi:hypothetical protein
MACTVKAVMPLGAQVVYEVEVEPGTALRVSEPRDAQTAMRETGERVQLVPTSTTACHVFPAS